jgi:hypothetical protein
MRLKTHDPRSKHIELDMLLTEHGGARAGEQCVGESYPDFDRTRMFTNGQRTNGISLQGSF